MRRSAFAIVIALAASPAALAADPQVIEAPEVIIADPDPSRFGDWTGFHAGVSIGYGWLEDVDRAFVPPLEASGNDWVYGVHLGYIHQWGRYVAGAEFEYQRQDIQFVGLPVNTEDLYAGKLRAGVAYGAWMATANVGLVYATTNVGLDDWGLLVGMTAEYAVSQNMSVGVEYAHQFYRNFDRTLIDADLDTVKLRFDFRF